VFVLLSVPAAVEVWPLETAFSEEDPTRDDSAPPSLFVLLPVATAVEVRSLEEALSEEEPTWDEAVSAPWEPLKAFVDDAEESPVLEWADEPVEDANDAPLPETLSSLYEDDAREADEEAADEPELLDSCVLDEETSEIDVDPFPLCWLWLLAVLSDCCVNWLEDEEAALFEEVEYEDEALIEENAANPGMFGFCPKLRIVNFTFGAALDGTGL
jgi:hypothetical protein